MPVAMEYVSSGFESTVRSLFERGEPCIKCPPITPSCPVCASDEICSQTSQSCHQCQSTTCIKLSATNGNVPPVPSPVGGTGDGGPNVGAIAGGVVGGVAAIAIATYLIWRFCIKGRAIDYDDEFDDDGAGYPVEKRTNYAQSTSSRNTTITRSSVASTAFTRASNVIQIAFIPGITDRNGGTPPVPPIPLAGDSRSSTPGSVNSPLSGASAFSEGSGQDHYFLPNDLRNSAWSNFTDDSSLNRGGLARGSVARSSMARQSITPSLMRESVASTIFNHDVMVQSQAAQTAARGRANVVQVKQSPNGSPQIPDVPTVPKIDFAKYGQAGQAPEVVDVNQTSQEANSSNATIPAPSQPQSEEAKREELTAKIKEAARRASQQPRHGGLGSVNQQSNPENPFSDNSANVIPE